MTTPTLADYVGAHEQQYALYNDLCSRSSDEQMATQSLCPDWDVRGVITHVIGVESVLDGWAPSVDVPPPFEELAPFEAEVTALDRDAFAARIAEITASRLAHLESLDPAVLDEPSITPAGIATYGRFLQIRLFDLWVHWRDIAIPLGDPTDDSGFAAETALQEVDDAIGYIVGKRIGLPDGKSVVFHIRGGVDRDIAVVVDGRATRVDSVESPDVEVTADVETFVMLAAGRIDPRERIDAGRISWAGDEQWGEMVAGNLAYTM
jgi:uncharacterized protein (TIGR03083 family)